MKENIVFREINQKAFYLALNAFRYYLDRRQQQNLFVLLLFTLRNFWRGEHTICGVHISEMIRDSPPSAHLSPRPHSQRVLWLKKY